MTQSSDTHVHGPAPIGDSPRSTGTTLGRGVRLGRFLGLDITIDFSLLLVFALVLFNLGFGILPAWHPEWPPPLLWGVAICAALLFFGSIFLHELSHALVGRRLGVPVSGITLFMFGGMAHLEREPTRASAELWMALAGPLTSLLIGFGSILLGGWIGTLGGLGMPEDPLDYIRHLGPVATLLLWLGPVNILLGLFNLLPGFPLDGGRVLRALVWWMSGDLLRATRIAARAGLFLSWALIGAGVLMAFGFRIPILGQGFGSGLWLVLIGWFLGQAARGSYASLITRQVLENVRVRELMWTRPETASPEETIRNLVRQQMLHSDQQLFPVISDGELLGAVSLSNVRQVPEEDWDRTLVEQIMTPHDPLKALSPNADATDALRLLNDPEAHELLVVDGNRLLGLVRRQDVLRWLSIHLDPARAELWKLGSTTGVLDGARRGWSGGEASA